MLEETEFQRTTNFGVLDAKENDEKNKTELAKKNYNTTL